MSRGQPTGMVKFFLFMVFLIGIGLNTFVILDAEHFRWIIRPPNDISTVDLSKFVPEAKKSILLVVAIGCDNKACGTGTGFVIQPGYVATNAHVAACGAQCKKFALQDYKGMKHVATLEGITSRRGTAEDLAILKINDTSLPPLQLADSAEYEVDHDGDAIFTIGYPLLGIASSADKASVSDEGRIAQFSTDHDMFIANGMQPNPGNSGGPVFLANEKKVVGLIVSGVRGEVQGVEVAGVEYVIPINRMKNFFQQITGQDLP
ncbi:S1C family serine protease [Desulfonema magnum]|uniref:S1C family serine protease n=1 Tax=Desulfonema magnum TaxID=45655 RepID=UPI001A9B1765|nr:serine protease [Desulfonema magnum]